MYVYIDEYISMWKSSFYSMTIFKYQFISTINCHAYILFHLTIFILFFLCFAFHFFLVLLCTPGWLCTLYEIKAGL